MKRGGLDNKDDHHNNNNDHHHHDYYHDSFQHFCNTSRLSSNSSMLIRHFVYYLKVIQAPITTMQRLVGTVALDTITQQMHNHTIITPDINALKEFIKETHHSGPPHACLRLFKERCIPGTVHWSTVLRLYLAAYCQPVAKELWQFAIMMAGGGLCGSTETEMTTQRFVSQTPIEIDPIIDLILDEAAAAAVG